MLDTDAMRLADAMHAMWCEQNHIDACGYTHTPWDYYAEHYLGDERIDYTSKGVYYRRAVKTLKYYGSFDVAVQAMKYDRAIYEQAPTLCAKWTGR